FLYFEINEYLGAEMTELITYLGFKNCSIKKDIYGKDRMMRASL
ncbi:MAG: release factor glutamine methyltransferase, partial [Saprospiraceae bacterium]